MSMCLRCNCATKDTKLQLCDNCKAAIREEFRKNPFAGLSNDAREVAVNIKRKFAELIIETRRIAELQQELYRMIAQVMPGMVSLDDEPATPELLDRLGKNIRLTPAGPEASTIDEAEAIMESIPEPKANVPVEQNALEAKLTKLVALANELVHNAGIKTADRKIGPDVISKGQVPPEVSLED